MLGIIKAEPSPIGEGGGGDPIFSVGKDLMGPPKGVRRVRWSRSPLPAAASWQGRGAELEQATYTRFSLKVPGVWA